MLRSEETGVPYRSVFRPRFNLNFDKATVGSFDDSVNGIVIYEWQIDI